VFELLDDDGDGEMSHNVVENGKASSKARSTNPAAKKMGAEKRDPKPSAMEIVPAPATSQ